MQKLIILAIPLLFLCCNNNNERLLKALDAAGHNRGELETVLSYYSKELVDSLKLKAAIYLIENMPFHYSYRDTSLLVQYYEAIDSVMIKYKDYDYDYRDSIYSAIVRKYEPHLMPMVNDIEIIKSEYLIENIDSAYSRWEDAGWAEHLDFDEFCEYILPYKVTEGQFLDDWRQYCAGFCNESLTDQKYCPILGNNPYTACNIVNENLKRRVSPGIKGDSQLPLLRMKTLLNIPWGTCDDYAVMTLAVMRSKGIPCATDFTPQWSFRSMGHTWNVLLERAGKNTVFEGANGTVGIPHKKDHKMGKVFRMTYAINEEIAHLLKTEKYVPETFRMPFLKDVTDEYMQTVDIELATNRKYPNKYAYLSLFDNAEWQPVAWGKLSRHRAQFNKIGKDAVYLPAVFTPKGVAAIHDPVLVDIRGRITTLSPDKKHKQTLKLYRKHPALPNTYGESLRMRGARIEAANQSDFGDAKTVHTYTDVSNEIFIDRGDSLKYRYWRFFSGYHGFVNVAELAFFERGSAIAARGKIIGTEGSHREGSIYDRAAVFDGDLLTFFDAPTASDSWVGMDFGEPVVISRITCIMRGDGNEIEIGNEYELLYWGDGDWRSLGRRIASDIYLTFEDCPANALFLLHNHTKGAEERIFTYENDQQRWW